MNKVLDAEKKSSDVFIRDVMTSYSKLVTTTGETTLSECRQIMVDKNIRHLPIMKAPSSKIPIGVISMREIIRSMQQVCIVFSTSKQYIIFISMHINMHTYLHTNISGYIHTNIGRIDIHLIHENLTDT